MRPWSVLLVNPGLQVVLLYRDTDSRWVVATVKMFQRAVFADLTGLPLLLIQVVSHEALLDDAVRLAERAAQLDVPVRLQVWPGLPHRLPWLRLDG